MRLVVVPNSLYLNEFMRSDKPALVQYLGDREIYDRTLRIPHPYTEANADTWLTQYEKVTESQGQPLNFAIRDADEQLLGGIGFKEFCIGKSHRAEIGYWLARPFWNRGLMTLVLRKVCDFGFAELKLVKIAAEVFPGNVASARVLEKCGFVLEGYLRKHCVKDGKYLDAKLYALFA